MANAPPPTWAINRIRECNADGLKVPYIAAQLRHQGLVCTERQVRRWKDKYAGAQIWRGGDAQLDALLQPLLRDGTFGREEGYRWLHEEVNEQLAPLRVGKAVLFEFV